MRELFTCVFALSFFLIMTDNSNAIMLIDSGQTHEGAPGYVADKEYWFATELKLTGPTMINGIYHWQYIYGVGAADRPIDLAIYADGGNIPDTSAEIYRTSYSIHETSLTDWYGVSDLNWVLGSGEYWISLEPFVNVDPQDTLYRFSTLPDGAPNSMYNNASAYQETYTNWNAMHSQPFQYGVRVTGEVIPEPATLFLFGAGFLGAFVRRKFVG